MLSPRHVPIPRRRTALAAVALLACAGCVATATTPAVPPPTAAASDRSPAWWASDDDPLLADLVAEGLAHAPRRVAVPASHGWLKHATDPAAIRALAESDADIQGLHALAIGLAYLEARRAQAHLALREDAVAGLKDNAEIAGFRREAGLVSAVDTGLAGVLVGLNENAILAARADRDAAVAALAGLIGDTPGPLTGRVTQAPMLRVYDALPPVTVDKALGWRADLAEMRDRIAASHRPATADDAAWQAALTRARGEIDLAHVALDAARARLSAATATSSAAESTVADARLAYRAGRTAGPALYVAEAAALAAREALVDAGVVVDRALLQLWSVEGRGAGGAIPTP